MFGTIGRPTFKPSQEARPETMMEERRREIRPKIAGPVVELVGQRAGQPDQVVFILLTQDEATYRDLAALPEQHQFYLRSSELFTGEPAWEDVEMRWGVRE